jgi:nitrogen regulatory protein PII
MKRITAVIKPFRLNEVKAALVDKGVRGMSVTEILGFGRQKGHVELFRGSEYDVDFRPKVQVDIVCVEDQVEEIIDTIVEGARTGEVGDGKIFVTPVEKILRIRTNETDRDAI